MRSSDPLLLYDVVETFILPFPYIFLFLQLN